jgi:hypothetical protein
MHKKYAGYREECPECRKENGEKVEYIGLKYRQL